MKNVYMQWSLNPRTRDDSGLIGGLILGVVCRDLFLDGVELNNVHDYLLMSCLYHTFLADNIVC